MESNVTPLPISKSSSNSFSIDGINSKRKNSCQNEVCVEEEAKQTYFVLNLLQIYDAQQLIVLCVNELLPWDNFPSNSTYHLKQTMSLQRQYPEKYIKFI